MQVAIFFPIVVALVSLLPTLTPSLSFFKLFSSLIDSLFANKCKYKYKTKNVTIKFSTILPKNIMTTYEKTFMKIVDLTYFS